MRQRATIRAAVLGLPIAELLAALVLPDARWWLILNGAAVCLLLFSAWLRVVSWFVSRQHRVQVVEPLARSLAGPLGMGLVTADEWVTVPPSFTAGDPDAVVRIDLPDSAAVEPSTRKLVEEAIRHKLGAPDAVVSWRLEGKNPHVTARRRRRPPERVTLADVRDQVEAARESAPLLGLGRGGDPVSVDLDMESPHIAVSMGTGAGKSALVRAAAAQLMAHGAQVVVIDLKRTSHQWVKGLPGCLAYARTPAEAHDALLSAGAMMAGRYEQIEADPDADLGPRLVVVVEELNLTASRLVRHWQSIRGTKDPKVSPAVEALGELLFAGRAARVHVIAVGQSLTVRALGNDPAQRENFGARVLGRYSAQMWRMLAGNIPMPPTSRHPGRVQLVADGAAVECQSVWWTEAEARDWAQRAGEVEPAPLPAVPVPVPTGNVEDQDEDQDEDQGNDDAGQESARVLHLIREEPMPRELVSLTDACGPAGVLTVAGVSLVAARKARTRETSFPEAVDRRGVELLYEPSALAAWAMRRRLTPPAAPAALVVAAWPFCLPEDGPWPWVAMLGLLVGSWLAARWCSRAPLRRLEVRRPAVPSVPASGEACAREVAR